MADHFHDNWTQIDENEDPDFFLHFLDLTRASSLAEAERDPERYFSWLQPFAGMRVLEVGCGPGNLTQILHDLAGTGGCAVGLDNSRYLIAEARRRAEDGCRDVEFVAGDAHNLPFPDDSFDRAITNTTLQHVRDPQRVLAEMRRISRPGGLIAAAEPDWETLIVDDSDADLSRRLTHAFVDGIRHGRIGRQLCGLFHAVGLTEVTVQPETAVYRKFDGLPSFLWAAAAALVRETHAAPAEAIEAWLADLQERSRLGTFFGASTGFRCIGRVPVEAPE